MATDKRARVDWEAAPSFQSSRETRANGRRGYDRAVIVTRTRKYRKGKGC